MKPDEFIERCRSIMEEEMGREGVHPEQLTTLQYRVTLALGVASHDDFQMELVLGESEDEEVQEMLVQLTKDSMTNAMKADLNPVTAAAALLAEGMCIGYALRMIDQTAEEKVT